VLAVGAEMLGPRLDDARLVDRVDDEMHGAGSWLATPARGV
jgi:hypothetical protein